MFLGEYRHNIDIKGRLAIPARFRGDLVEGLVITRGLDPCLNIYPKSRWLPLAEQLSELPTNEPAVRLLRRNLFTGAFACEMDKQGRILVPQTLREYAGLDGDVVIAGLNIYLEVWATARWDEELPRFESEASSLAEQLSNLGLTF